MNHLKRLAIPALGYLVPALLSLTACEIRQGTDRPASPPPPAYPPAYPPAQGGAAGPPPYGPGPGPSYGPAPAPAPASAAPAPGAPGGADPILSENLMGLRSRAQELLNDLVRVLPNDRKGRVERIPFVFDDTPGDVNAFAACVDGRALMAITDGMLIIAARLAEAAANDEVFGTRKVDEYVAFIAQNQRPGAPLVDPPAGFFDPQQRADARRQARHRDAFDETIAFVLGHELAHHYLGHLPCTAGASALGAGDIARAISGAVPIFNQPNELAADVAGTNNVLVAGSQRASRWSEKGGLLTMRFFAGVDGMSPVDVLFAFESSHPPPGVRVPVIQQAANTWRLTGGWLPIISL